MARYNFHLIDRSMWQVSDPKEFPDDEAATAEGRQVARDMAAYRRPSELLRSGILRVTEPELTIGGLKSACGILRAFVRKVMEPAEAHPSSNPSPLFSSTRAKTGVNLHCRCVRSGRL